MAQKLNLSIDASELGLRPGQWPTRITHRVDGVPVDFWAQYNAVKDGETLWYRYETLGGCIHYPGDSGVPTGNVLIVFND